MSVFNETYKEIFEQVGKWGTLISAMGGVGIILRHARKRGFITTLKLLNELVLNNAGAFKDEEKNKDPLKPTCKSS